MPITQGVHQIPYLDYPAYGERWSPDGVETVRTLSCSWDVRERFVTDLIGTARWQGLSRFNRQVPEQHPHYAYMFAVNAQLREPQGVPGADAGGHIFYYSRNAAGAISAAPGLAVYDVTYRALDFDVLKDDTITTELERFVERNSKPSVDSLTLPGQSVRWALNSEDSDSPTTYAVAADAVIPEPMARAFPTCAFTYTWHQVPGALGTTPYTSYLPLANILEGLGKVNSNHFDAGYGPVNVEQSQSFTKVFPAGTLLFTAAEIRRVRGAAGAPLFQVQYTLLYRPNKEGNVYKGWNSLLHPKRTTGPTTAKFVTVYDMGTTSKGIYESFDFNRLFRFTP